MYFLIEYCRTLGTLVQCEPYEDRECAQGAMLTWEITSRQAVCGPHEVVLLDAESEAALRTTHGRYFLSARELMEQMREAV